jgi:hypothetical protein
VKAFALAALALVAIFVVVHLMGGGLGHMAMHFGAAPHTDAMSRQ